MDWNYGKVNAAVPQRTAIKGISKWWATAGQDEINTTLSLDIAEKGKYELDIDIGSWAEGAIDSEWGLTLKSKAVLTLLTLESGEVIEEARFGELTGKIEFSQELNPGVYELEITNIEVPKKPIIEQVEFILILNRRIRDLGPGNAPIEIPVEVVKDRLTALFIADRPEPNLEQSQINELINEYAPILYFDQGRICDPLDSERYTVPLDVQYTWPKNMPWRKGDANQTFNVYNSNYEGTVYQDKTKGAIYAAVVENEEINEIAINYYFHYPVSNWKEYEGYNNHVGDWEGITVFLHRNGRNKFTPDRVAFSQHVKFIEYDTSYTVPWDLVDNKSNHPSVYVGLGGHASFPFAGITEWVTGQELHKGDLDLAPFKPFDVNQVHYLERAGKLNLEHEHNWLLYSGRWGDNQRDNQRDNRNYPQAWENDEEDEEDEKSGGSAPRGPMFLDTSSYKVRYLFNPEITPGLGERWFDPWNWSDDFETLKIADPASAYDYGKVRNILAKNSGLLGIREFAVAMGIGSASHVYRLNFPYASGSSSFIRDFGSSDDKLNIFNSKRNETLYPQGLQPGKFGFARLGDDLFIDLNKNGTIEMVDSTYSDSPQDLMIIDFFGEGRIEEIRSSFSSDVGDEVYNNLQASSIDSVCKPPESEPKPKRDLEGVSGRIFGDPHLLTFDRRRLSFQAVGEFIQAQTLDDQFEVQGRYKQAGENASLVNAVAIKLGQDRVGFYAGQNSQLRINGKLTTVEDNLLVLPGGGQIYRDNGTYVVVSPNGEGVKVQEVSAGDGSLIVEVVMPETQRGQVKGLLGNFNGDSSDDIQTRTGEVLPKNPNYEQLYKEFGNSWRIHHRESLFDYAPGETTATFTNSSFPAKIVRTNDFSSNARAAAERTCQAAGVTEPELLEACIFDILVTRDNRFVQVSASVAQTLTSSIEATPDEGRIRDGDYSEGPGEFALTVQGNRYRYYGGHDGWISEWFPISKLQYIRDGVVFDGETYWCHLEDKGETGWICSANGW
ncbi:MAG: hypothetical protein F6K41_03295 [Symploca sp. SIO3E6]|nr:hypothetical protein [Caldora sp. SIO3E6]